MRSVLCMTVVRAVLEVDLKLKKGKKSHLFDKNQTCLSKLFLVLTLLFVCLLCLFFVFL